MIDSFEIKPFRVIERLTIVAPLGLRFWDEVTGKTIGDGLIVTAYSPDNPARRTRAVVNRSSTYILRNLPGLHSVEMGEGDSDLWNNILLKRSFIIEVVDSESRFLPFTFRAEAPVRGIFDWKGPPSLSPPARALGVPLSSSQSRPAPAAMAVIRADLHEWRSDADHVGDPAAWAVVEAQMGGQPVARGFADDQGRITLMFPYPDPVTDSAASPPDFSHHSPPRLADPSLRNQEWTIELVAAYGRLRPAPPLSGIPPMPDLSDVFHQPPATLYADSKREDPLREATLRFGRELVVRSQDFSTDIRGVPMPVLFITPVGSPP